MKKKILMIGTGGSIASKQTEAGLAPGLSSEDILSYIPQVESVCDVDTLQVCNIDSTNVTRQLYLRVRRCLSGCDDRIRWESHCRNKGEERARQELQCIFQH